MNAAKPRYRLTEAERDQRRQQALTRAVSGTTLTNWPAIFEGFLAMGIPESEIRPRENVFTFEAWKALRRHVRKGEHGVKVVTWITAEGKQTDVPPEGEDQKKAYRFCRSTTVFHASQTEANEVQA